MIVKKHFEKIAFIIVITLQGCATNPVAAPVKEKIPFTAAQAEENRRYTEQLEQRGRDIDHQERKRRTDEEVKILNAQKPVRTTIYH